MKNISRILILTILLNFSFISLNVEAKEFGIKVEYDPNGGVFEDGNIQNKIRYGQAGESIESYYDLEKVTKDGYNFQGWKLVIDEVPYAKFTVNYIDEEDDKLIDSINIDNKRVGEVIASNDYKKDISDYEFIRVSKDEITLEEGNNTLDFYYRKNKVEEKVKYTIRYLNKETNMPVIKSLTSAERQEDLIFWGKPGEKIEISQHKKTFGGYDFIGVTPSSNEFILDKDEKKNVIKFLYLPQLIIVTPPGDIDFGMFGYLQDENQVIASSKESLEGLIVSKKENIILEKNKTYKLVANWKAVEKNTPIIRLNSNGGSFGLANDKVFSITANNGAKIKDLSLKLPTRTGYTFKAWTMDIAGKIQVNQDKVLSYNEILDIYAQWEINKVDKFNIRYDGNGSTSGSVPVDSNKYLKDDTVKVLDNGSLRREKHSFKGWSTNSNSSGVSYKNGDSFSIKNDVVLYAVWEKDSSGGGDKPDPEKPRPVNPDPDKPGTKDSKGREYGTVIEPKVEYELNKKDHYAYIKGYKDETAKPNGYITREEVAVVFYRLMEPEYRSEIETVSHTFTDLDKDRWSEKAIATLSKGEVLKGYTDGSFKPTNNMTRGEVAKAITRFADVKVLETEFPDIIGHWAEDYINTAGNEGWIKGYNDGTFKPNELLTRAEFVTMMNSLLDRKVKKENALQGLKTFRDLPEEWYYEQMIEAINGHNYDVNRITDGTEKWTELVETKFPD